MKKRVISFLLVICVLLSLSGCLFTSKSDSTFSIRFIDVGQGDAALIECDGRYMLIDGGPESNGEKLCNILVEENINHHLDILAISHLDEDHIGGLIKAFEFINVDLTITNSLEKNTKVFEKLEPNLYKYSKKIKIPAVGSKFKLGSAEIEVIDNSSEQKNDSLVLLITYQNTRFLFTGDIQYEAQMRLTEKLNSDKRSVDGIFKIDLIKMPHHGAYNNEGYNDSNLNGLFNVIKTKDSKIYAVISVGKNNGHGHPDSDTLDLLKQADAEIYRTDEQGDIVVKSDGKSLSFETSK